MKEYCDFYFRKAKAENYPARSIYKLKEIDAKFGILRKGMRVLDLGAAPGSWSLGAAEKTGPSGLVLACDIQEASAAFPGHVIFMREDIFAPSQQFLERLSGLAPFGLVLSDMAPATTGNRITDHARSLELACAGLDMAAQYLGSKGNLVAKIFMGPDINEFVAPARKMFSAVKNFKPKSSRPESKEIFIVCQGFKLAVPRG